MSSAMSSRAQDSMLHLDMQIRQNQSPPSSSSRILDIPCKVCGDFSSGKHYNIFACDGCAGFFKRSIRRNREYVCKAKEEGSCVVDKTHRNQCRACRLAKCHEAGMNKDAVQHERGPRNSTLRRQQMAHFLDPRDRGALDLAIPKAGVTPPMMEPALPTSFMYSPSSVHLPPAPVLHPMLQPAAICESAARLLFMNVQWTRSLPTFTTLPNQDQFLLLEESWRELFILGASQFLLLDLTSLVQACGYLDREPERAVGFLQEVRTFQETLAKIVEFRLDPHEFACLRAIVLFKTCFEKPSSSNSSVSSTTSTDSRSLTDLATVTTIQEHTQLTLNKYITTVHPGQPLRFGKILMLLPSLRNVSSNVIEELFFRQSIGHIPIVRIICDMYKSPKPEMYV